MSNLPEKIILLNQSLKELEKKSNFLACQSVVNQIANLLEISASKFWKLFEDSNGKIRSNASWFMMAEGFADKRASYKIAEDNGKNIDLKVYWIKKASKSIIGWLVALTPNFEDEPFYKSKNIGIDFIIPEKADRVIVVLSHNYIIRILELKGELSITQQEIFAKWLQTFDFTNKEQAHNILWKSFDLEPLNKKFYKEVSSFFVELKQYLSDKKIFDERHSALFTNRLIGRIIFCWFLEKKEIINSDFGYFDIQDKKSTEYYREKLETLFFKVFNTPINEREDGIDEKTPFLNGGLFESREHDKFGDLSLTFPADYFDRLFVFLRHYNFTTDESTSSFQQVAIDPEMLGRIFENLLAEQTEETGEQARKAKGAFYTPREIVDYMCKESLREYLKTCIKETSDRDEQISKLLDSKIHEYRDQQRNYKGKIAPYKKDIIKALNNLKIIDPACGSGAFPMGMMQLLLITYERLEPRFNSYISKLDIIKKNIYGVDIEPMAVEISRLRAWLSIVVDEESDSKKIKPLPNLDFKFVCANSLIPLDGNEKQTLDDAGKLNEMEKEMLDIRDSYFKAWSTNGKNKLKEKFNKLILKKNQGVLFSKSTRREQIESYHPFDSENVTEFFDSEFMFGLSGFDVVIGNPPYIRASKMNKAHKLNYKVNYKTAYGSYDIFSLFFEKAFNLLTRNGVYCYITSNKFLIADYAKPLRKLIRDKTNLLKLVDLADCKRIFESALVSSIITLGKNGKSNDKNVLVAILKDNDVAKINSINFTSTSNPFSIHLIDSKTHGLIDKIRANAIDFEKIADIRTGVMGFDYWSLEPFVVDKYRENFIRLVTNGFVDQYCYTWGKKGRLYKKDFTEPYLDLINVNLNKNTKELFLKKKIIIRGVAQRLTANIDNQGCGILVAVHSAISLNESEYNNKLILALLNSKLLNWVHLKEFYSARIPEGSLKYPISFIKKLPIKKIVESGQRILIDLVDQILDITSSPEYDPKNPPIKQKELEKKIDELVYKLYDLTDEEIKIIEEDN